MCLYPNGTEIKTADHPIVCYKVVSKHPYFKDAWISPIWMYCYRIGINGPQKITVLTDTDTDSGDSVKIVREGFHTFVNIGDAFEYRKRIYHQTVILKCEIPVGADYIEGVNSDMVKNYVSSAINVVGEM